MSALPSARGLQGKWVTPTLAPAQGDTYPGPAAQGDLEHPSVLLRTWLCGSWGPSLSLGMGPWVLQSQVTQAARAHLSGRQARVHLSGPALGVATTSPPRVRVCPMYVVLLYPISLLVVSLGGLHK